MFRLPKYLRCIAILILFLNTSLFEGQNDSISGIPYIQKLIQNDSINKAKTELNSQLDVYRREKNTDSLIRYIFLVGSLKLANDSHDLAIKNAEAFGEELKTYNSPFVDKEFLLELAWIYDDAGYTKRAYEIVEDAYNIAIKIDDPKKAGLSGIYHNFGYLASNLGNYALAKKQYAKSIKAMEDEDSDDYENFHKTYNALGGMMWYSAKLDSSLYYFNKSLKMLDKSESTPINLYYRRALVQMNIAVINHSLGHIERSIESSKEVISSFQKYLNTSHDESRKLRALKHQLAAIDNLGSFYHSIGEFERADKLITYAYHKKLKNVAPDDNNLTISLIISAQAKIGLRDFKTANKLIDEALERINSKHNTQFFWEASALSTKASISHEIGDDAIAEKYYEEAYKLYQNSLGKGDYTRDFLDEIINMSQFYASIKNAQRAIGLAKESYNFIKRSDFKSTIQEFHHTVNLSEVYYKLEQYNQAIRYSDEALSFLNNQNMGTINFRDSVQVQYRKPKALLIKTKSKYALTDKKTETDLLELLEQTNDAIKILEQRKTIIKSYDDLSLLIAENNELFSFSKQLHLDLFHLTNDENYLTKFLTIHESSVYNRIRTRLNLKNDIAFTNVPKQVIKRENTLRKALKSSIRSNDGSFSSFFDANSNWNAFLDSLKQTFPKYYKMRYASIEEPLDNLRKYIPKNTTVVRYMYVDTTLHAFVISKDQKELFKLKTDNVSDFIKELAENQSDLEPVSHKLHQLYQQLWQPFESKINTEHVIIIPDGNLFNLSFESLTPFKINSFKDLKSKSLLSDHYISYNYSLLLLGKNKKPVNYKKDFVAFAPEFNDRMKNTYKVAITDSIGLDKTYLSLLPQPFSVDLAKEYSQVFNGDYFINENASKQIFKNEANEHKIIHIGTHAESNNITPELSRLIFAKNEAGEDNSLYTFEIYNENLNSNLAILTACETGKPTYQAGEGMISLAHAFNYAGSESILTSLWKIDEKSSAEIIKLFYKYIKRGLPKDKALRRAKLDYISNTEDRTVTPQYWAGLVLIGDNSPIIISGPSKFTWYLISILILITVAIILIIRRNKVRV